MYTRIYGDFIYRNTAQLPKKQAMRPAYHNTTKGHKIRSQPSSISCQGAAPNAIMTA